MMKLFSSPSNSYLGVDIGSAGIKIVELKDENGQPRLLTYGFAEEPVDIIRQTSPQTQNRTAEILRKIVEKSRITTKKTVTALPSFSVFSSIISLPLISKKELAKAIYWQAKKFIPLPLEEMTLDWKMLDENNQVTDLSIKAVKTETNVLSNQNIPSEPGVTETAQAKSDLEKYEKKEGKKDLKVLIAAAPKKLVGRYVEVFQKAGLELVSLETENFALERALVGGDKTPVMIVDIGTITSDISVVEGGIPLLSRSVDTGGEDITQVIAKSLRIDEKRAEQFKRDLGFTSGPGNLPKAIESAIAPIINEIKYCFDLYASKQSSQGIEKIILTGGSAFLPNITNYLSQLLEIKVFIGNPWSRIIYPLDLKPVLDGLAPRFSVAIGLAMREIV